MRLRTIDPMKKAPSLAEASPYKSVAEELVTFQRTFREVCDRYASRVNADIGHLRERVVAAGITAAGEDEAAAGPGKRPGAIDRFHDLRDMLTLLRTLQLKPSEGRRKDLKKIEAVLEELLVLSKAWA